MGNLSKETNFPSKFENFILHNVCDGDLALCGDLADHGADSGYAYLTYTSDIMQVMDEYTSQIDDIVGEFADGVGQSVPEMFAEYCKRRGLSGTYYEYATYLVYSAAEIVARELAEQGARDDEKLAELAEERMELDDDTE